MTTRLDPTTARPDFDVRGLAITDEDTAPRGNWITTAYAGTTIQVVVPSGEATFPLCGAIQPSIAKKY
jgi:hypothetical protein